MSSILKSVVLVALSGVLLAGCASHRSSASVDKASASSSSASVSSRRAAKDIVLTEEDVTDRKYAVLGDISVSVSKTTLFDQDPTREMVNERLREEAYKLGADAVILTRYGTVGIGLASWGVLEGKGRAVAFKE